MTVKAPYREQLPALRALWQEAFGDGEAFLDAFEQTAFHEERCRCVTVDGRTVAALYWFDCAYGDARVAYLYAIATVKAYRGRGLCAALMEDTHRHLNALGYEGAILVPGSKKLFAFYEKFGYRTCSHVAEVSCRPSADALSVRRIGIEEYAALRRLLLPEGGVLQENENLRFLQTQATLYAGEGFLLAARREGDTLFGAELLGDATVAPAIVRSLGCKDGRFRTPGKDIPFAMYLSLGEEKLAPPSYFGIAFD